MAAQSFLAKLGLRLSTLGSLGTLAFAFPLSEGSGDVTAQTDPTRCGFYAVAATKVATVVNGSEIFAVTTSGVHSSLAGATNEMIGTGAGNVSMSGTNNVLLGHGAGGALTSANDNTIVGAIAGPNLTSGGSNVLVGYEAGAALSTQSANTYVGQSAGGNSVAGFNTALGYNAGVGAAGSTAAGFVAIGASTLSSVSTGQNNTAVGYNAGTSTTTGGSNIFLGYNSGDSTAAGASNRMVAGAGSAAIGDVFIGNGEIAGTPQSVIYHATGGTGANIAGASFTLAGGISTGSAAGGSVVIQTSPKSTSSSTPNTLTTRWTVAGDGGTTWTGIATASAPALSPANSGTIYYDATAQTFYQSSNGGAYAALGGGGGTIGGSIANTQVAVGSGTNTIAGSANLIYSSSILTINTPVAGTNPGAVFAVNDQTAAQTNPQLAILASTASDNSRAGFLIASHPTDWTQLFGNVAAFGSGIGTSSYGGTTDAGKVMFYAQGSSVTRMLLGTFNNVPLDLMSNNTVYFRAGSSAVTIFANTSTPASAVGGSGLNIGQGVAPTSPNNGDVWMTTAGMWCQANGVTIGPFGAGTGTVTGTGTSGELVYWNGTSSVTGSSTLSYTTAAGVTCNQPNTTGTETWGSNAGNTTMSGTDNTFLGNSAGTAVTTASFSTIIGFQAGQNITAGNSNTIVGYQAGQSAGTSASQSIAIGLQSGQNMNGQNNTFVGVGAGKGAGGGTATGAENVAIGAGSLPAFTTGNANVVIGYGAGPFTTTGQKNIFLGFNSGDSTAAGASNRMVCGGNSGSISAVYIGNGETNAAPAAVVYNATGGSGANIAGASLTLAGGIGTGTGVGGNIIFQVSAAAGGSSSTPNTLTTIFTINSGLYGQFAAGVTYPISTKTANYTMLSTDSTILADTTSSAFTITLMASPPTGMIVNVKMIGSGANNLTITPSSGTIDGSASLTITTLYANNQLQWNGTNWYIL